MLPNMMYSSEKMMQWQQRQLEKEAKELWMWRSIKEPAKKLHIMMIISLFFFV